MSRASVVLAGSALLGVAAVAAAVWTQVALNMQPCPWCILQRVIFLAIALAAVIGMLWRSALGRRVGAALALALAGCGAAAALWQHFVAASSASCNLTLADRIVGALGLDARWPQLFMATATCADAKVDLLGVPFEFWSLGLFVLLAAAAVAVLIRPRG
jgi:disulfide bond formation protein DsbB